MTMQRLTEIIGPAPNELPPDEHIALLQKERDRVRSALQAWRTGFDPNPRKRTKPKKAKKPPTHPVIIELRRRGLTDAQIEKVIQATQAEKGITHDK